MNSRFYSFLLAVGFLTCAGHLASQSAPELSGEWRSQFTRLEQEMKERDWCDRVAGQTEHPAALLTAGDRDPLDVVLRRSEALLAHLAGQPDAPDLAAERNQLTALAAKSANRPNPNYTLHAMMRNGSDIIPLSFHETNEWNPSINHNGMIA